MTDAERSDSPPWPPPWPTAHPSEPTPPSPTARGRTAPAVLALVGVVALLAGAAGAAAGISAAGRSPDASSSPAAAVDGSRVPESVELPTGDGSSPIDVGAIATAASPAVVNISATSRGSQGAGSGMILTRSGQVLTNSHVISGATDIEVEVGVTGETYSAEVLGYDVEDDVALLQLEDAKGMATIRTAPASSVSTGDAVVAIGNALGRFGAPNVAGGTVTALDQDVAAGDGFDRELLHDMIRVAATIRPGDSGGALLDADGRVIAMITAASAGTGADIGFAIPIDRALSVVSEIRAGDSSNGAHIGPRAMLGVVLREAPAGTGAAVVGVADGTPAEGAGLRAGATITALDGTAVASTAELRAALDSLRPGDQVSVTWVDGTGDRHRARVTLAAGPPG